MEMDRLPEATQAGRWHASNQAGAKRIVTTQVPTGSARTFDEGAFSPNRAF
jgi:hypothetical protein